jgi:hypothetical protein
MHGLPVSFVNLDQGARLNGRRVELGDSLERALLTSLETAEKLAVHVESLAQAEDRMSAARRSRRSSCRRASAPAPLARRRGPLRPTSG